MKLKKTKKKKKRKLSAIRAILQEKTNELFCQPNTF